MTEQHEIQLYILHKLLFAKSLRYSQVLPDEMESSQFQFHMRRLIKQGLVKKMSSGSYSLTEVGVEYANRMHKATHEFRKQPKVTTGICPIRPSLNEILIYTRLKNPFYGCQGFATEKVWYGESILNAARRGLREETNLDGVPELIGVRNYKVYSKENELLEDKIFFIHRFIDPKGDLKSTDEGKFEWVKIDDVEKVVTNPLEEFRETLEILLNYKGTISFKEVTHLTDKF